MIGKGILIFWSESIEYIGFDCDNLEKIEQVNETCEKWDNYELVKYNIQPIVKRISESEYMVTISYEREKNISLVNKNVLWGESKIKIKKGEVEGKVEWKDYNYDENDGVSRWVRVDSPIKGKRRRTTTTKLQRAQEKFRKLLLKLDRCCVLTKETTAATLEAAHIIPVSEGGTESIGNGIILRADLHRLFDSGAFRILPTGLVEIKNQSLSSKYKCLLKSAQVNGETLERVKKALITAG